MASIFDRDELNESLFYPRGDTSDVPDGATDLFVDVDDARLHVRIHAADAARCTLLLFHGNGEVVADYDRTAAEFADAGARLAVADYRGYGESIGTPTLRAAIADARPIADAVRAATRAPLVVMGRSLGGAPAHELYAKPIDGMIGVVLESAFFELAGLIERRGMRPPARYAPDELAVFDPATKLRRGTLPLLILHGADDTLVSPDDARSAHAAAGGTNTQLAMIADRGHNDVSAEPAYWDALAAFIARVA